MTLFLQCIMQYLHSLSTSKKIRKFCPCFVSIRNWIETKYGM